MRRVMTWALLLFSIGTSLIVSELTVRALIPQKLAVNVTQWDRYVGFANKPGAEGTSQTSDYTMTVRINTKGLRDRNFSYEKSPTSFRIGVFGDSFTFGEGVESEETYPKVLERFLNHRLADQSRGIEVLNLGIGKTGTSHQFAFYQKEGVKYNFDLVVLGFLSGNDFRDNWEGVFHLRDGELVHNPTRYSSVRRIQGLVQRIPFYSWGARHSHLVNLARTVATVHDDKVRARDASNPSTATLTADELALAQVELTRELIDAFRKAVEQRGGRFLVANLPARNQRPPDHYAAEGTGAPVFVRQCDRLLRQLANGGLRIVDLIGAFQRSSSRQYYFPNDGHMNARGHQEVAWHIYLAIADQTRPGSIRQGSSH